MRKKVFCDTNKMRMVFTFASTRGQCKIDRLSSRLTHPGEGYLVVRWVVSIHLSPVPSMSYLKIAKRYYVQEPILSPRSLGEVYLDDFKKKKKKVYLDGNPSSNGIRMRDVGNTWDPLFLPQIAQMFVGVHRFTVHH